MQDLHIDIIGVIAGTCTTVSFVPQLVKILRTKKVRDISLYMYIILTTGIFLWLVYGICLKRVPIILANGISFLVCLFIIIAKIVYGKESNR